MTYPNFGKVRTIVLPIDYNDPSMSLEEYKDKYGVDISNFIFLDEGNHQIILSFPDFAQILLCEINYGLVAINGCPHIAQPNNLIVSQWDSGNSDGRTTIFYANDVTGFGLSFAISQDDDFKIENIIIELYEI